ncbi:MAG: DNA polymerase I [Clostridiales bacterium]|nr:DNA polymerase I [Clostridiales bacterium]
MEKFVIIDGNSLINRAYYGLPMLKSLSGKPCNATYGFTNMMLSMILSEKPKYLVCVFDAGKHTFRHDMYAEYKGTRDKMPEDLASQLFDLKELLKAMGIQTMELKEIEADDIVGSLTRKFNAEFILISGDKDLLQLVNDHTTVWLTRKGISDVLKVDEAVLMSEFGLKPYQVIELKSIMGDSSDNIPGVMGIGKIGANALIEQYGSLDNIYANIDTVPNKYKNKLIEHKDMAYLSHKLATIKLDVDLPFELKDCEYSLPFNRETYAIMQDLGFKSMLNRKDLFRKGMDTLDKIETENLITDIIEIDNIETLDNMLSEMKDSFAVYADQMSLHLAKNDKEYILYTSGEIFNKNIDKIIDLFAGEAQKICFDCKTLMHDLGNFGIKINNYFDVSLAIYIANELDAEITLDDALKLNEITTTARANPLFRLKEIYVNKLIKSLQLKLYSEIELPLVEVLYDMEKFGIKIDAEQIKTLSKSYHEELDAIVDKIYTLAGEEFNINSPKQLQSILFDKLKIEYKGKAGTSIEVLNAIADKHEIVNYIIRYRKIAKLISTYLDGMLAYVSDDGKIHTTFMQRTTSTGRLSSREPNLQNLPIRDDEGRVLRKMFSSSFENGTIISADYNQIELRLMANFSQDENMINDYLSGKDIHTATASKIFNLPIDFVDSSMRRVAKSVNFGIIYGIGAYGLSQNINSTVKEADEFIKKYLSIYPRVKEYGDELIASAREKGYAVTMMGRIRHLNDINSGNHTVRSFAERVAKNMPLQGSASDIIKIAMKKVYQRMKENNLKSKLVIQIHDELVVDCYPGESDIVKRILKEEMESVVDLKVPLLVEVSEGKTLYEAK